MTAQNRQELGRFFLQSVKEKTARTYERQWAEWCQFLLEEAGNDDPLLRGWRELDKPALVSLFLLRRYQSGRRDKQATAVTAGIRLRFTEALLPTDFMDSPMLTAARSACKRNTNELRQKKDEGASTSVKFPLCESVLLRMRERMWVGKGWGKTEIDQRMVYIGCVYGYDLGARVSEYTAPEKGNEDHCVRAGDLNFDVIQGERDVKVLGGAPFFDGSCNLGKQIRGCWVSTCSQKTGSPVATKLIGRRSVEETQFLEDLAEWISCARVRTQDRLFTRYLNTGGGSVSRKELSCRMVRDCLKATCVLEGLEPDYFSSHSLRKAAVTHMRALGVSDNDMKSRGNYAPGPQ